MNTNTKLESLKKLLKYFDLTIDDIENEKYNNGWTNWIPRIKILFKNQNKEIKAELKNGYFHSDHFKVKIHKAVSGGAWHCTYHGLYFFGLMDNKKNSNKNSIRIIIDDLERFNSFEEYLEYGAKEKILNNFKNDELWFQKRIIGASIQYAIENNLDIISATGKVEFIQKEYSSKYKFYVDSLLLIFLGENEKNNVEISSINENISNEKNNMDIKNNNDSEWYHKAKNAIKEYDKEEIIKKLKNKSDNEINQDECVKKLRKIFKDEINNEFNEFNKKSAIHNTFDSNLQFKFPEAAHIISVSQLINEKRLEEIANPNNGLLLDPNTHTLLDRDDLEYNKEEQTLYNEWHTFMINKKFINNKRQKYLDEKFPKK